MFLYTFFFTCFLGGSLQAVVFWLFVSTKRKPSGYGILCGFSTENIFSRKLARWSVRAARHPVCLGRSVRKRNSLCICKSANQLKMFLQTLNLWTHLQWITHTHTPVTASNFRLLSLTLRLCWVHGENSGAPAQHWWKDLSEDRFYLPSPLKTSSKVSSLCQGLVNRACECPRTPCVIFISPPTFFFSAD